MKRATLRIFLEDEHTDISIHALVKRATKICITLFFVIQISIHALVKRATMCIRSTVGSVAISIHALVKRATIYDGLSVRFVGTFQSTPS